MEFVAGIADTVLGRLASYASQEVFLARGAKLELTKLMETLTTINLVIHDAERKQVKNLLITHWLTKLKDICYDVDDVLNELEYRKLLKSMLVNKHGLLKGQVRHFLSIWNPSLFNFKLGHMVKEIRERLAEIDKERKQFGLIEVGNMGGTHIVPRMRQCNERETDSLLDRLEVVGRDDDQRLIFSHLLHDTTEISGEKNVSVISILGLGGLGKTMLAKLVYNDSRIQENFEVKMWVCVSNNFEVKSLVLKIINAATDGKCEDESLDRMKRRLQDTLKDRKFMLVLDDIWDTECNGVTHEKWLGLKSLLSVGADGSKILVTTRDRSVALLVNSVYIHSLDGLPSKECMSLFIKRTFKKGEDEHYPHLIEIGEDIVNKCRGVPLAVVTLGSMLYLTRETERWLSLRDDDLWSIGNDNIRSALKLSYDALPHHLKPCFAFCSLFPKDFEFSSDLLVEMWVAQDYIKTCKKNEDLHRLGMDYIREFCARSLFQLEDDFRTRIHFKMHDLVHDIAILVAQAEYSTVNLRPSSDFEKVRHVSISEKDLVGEDKQVPDTIFKSTKLRTFLIPEDGKVDQQFVKRCISSFKHMRLLDLCGSPLVQLPSSIGNLFSLKFLDLSYNNEIKRVPNSICKLLHLESLNLARCTALEELPKDIGNLINLRILMITTQQKYLPKGFSCLTSLQHLNIVGCVNLKSLGDEIQSLNNLHKLTISCCENLKSLPPNMKLLTALNALFISECPQLDLMETREGPQGLRSFGISTSDLKVLPTWLGDSTKFLQSMAIDDCHNLTQLPELQKFTFLETLLIARCNSLLVLPQGLHCLTNFRELEIIDCPKLSKICRRQFKGEDWSRFTSKVKIILDSDVLTDEEEGAFNDHHVISSDL